MPKNFENTVSIGDHRYEPKEEEQENFSGDYQYNTNSSSKYLTYYKDGKKETDDIHFSVKVDGQTGKTYNLRKFHITKPFGGANLHLDYYNNVAKGIQFDNVRYDDIAESKRPAAREWVSLNESVLDQVAQEFAQNLPKKTAIFTAFVPEPSAPPAATPLPSKADITATPILSQANAVGQGFDIFGQLNIESLLRPLVDSSRAPTQVFTFLGKEYLIPAYITAVESTNSYSNVAAGENREGFQNSIAAHAGVEGSYGAFSGEMKVDFTGEFNRNSKFTYGFIDFYTSLATLQLNTAEYLNADFRQAVADLPDVATDETLPPFIDFFKRYGVYYTQSVTLGGSLGFYTALHKEDSVTKIGFEFLLKAQYKGLFSSGKLDSKVEASAEWQEYSQSSQTNVRVLGGSAKAATALASVDPLGFSESTVAAFTGWADSVSTDPAIVDFSLKEIWNLAGNKSGVIEAAWELFGQTIRPRLTVQTTTGNTPWPLPQPEPPIVTIGQLIRPSEKPASPAGYQVIVLDRTNVSASGVLLNRYFFVPPQYNWPETYESVYGDILTALQVPGLAMPGNVLVLVSFGLDKSMTPTNDFYAFLLSAGAGALLRQWVTTADPGSKIGNPSIWVGSPVNYILVGLFGSGPDAGVEGYNQLKTSPTIQTEVLFYRTSVTGQYTLGAGS